MRLDTLSVIVPTKNEARNLPRLIASLPDMVDLILVDASVDATPEIAMRLRPQRTRVIRDPARIPAARNLGASAARTPWLLFTDADVRFAPDYFDRITQLPEQPGAWYGPKLADDDQADYYRGFSRWQKRFDRLGIPAVSGSNLLLHAKVFQQCGGFDPQLIVNEDTELGFRLKREGFEPHFNPCLVVYASDHRRLRRGKIRKDLHTLARCTLIYFNLFPGLWRGKDWGYWKSQTPQR